MAETAIHRDETMNAIISLQGHFAHDPLVHVSGVDFLYYVEGDPKKVVSPDCYVIFGVDKEKRDCYKAWDEDGHLPDVAIEFTSTKTRRKDTVVKFHIYEQELHVAEYFLFDPLGDYLTPHLQGWTLRDGRYIPMEFRNGCLHSEKLGLELVEVDDNMRFYNPQTGDLLPNLAEMYRMYENQKRISERMRERQELKSAAEAEIARLRAEIEALRRETS